MSMPERPEDRNEDRAGAEAQVGDIDRQVDRDQVHVLPEEHAQEAAGIVQHREADRRRLSLEHRARPRLPRSPCSVVVLCGNHLGLFWMLPSRFETTRCPDRRSSGCSAPRRRALRWRGCCTALRHAHRDRQGFVPASEKLPKLMLPPAAVPGPNPTASRDR